MFPTHTEGGDPDSLTIKKIKVKDPESETGNTLDVNIAFYLTSQDTDAFDVLFLVVVSRVHSVADFGLWGRGVDARGRLRGLEGDLSDF